MWKVINSFDATGRGTYLLMLNKQIPNVCLNGYRIDGKEYSVVHVHVAGRLDVIGIKDNPNIDFVGKEVEFVSAKEEAVA